MTTTEPLKARSGRRPPLGAAVLGLVLLLGSCTSVGGQTTSSTGPAVSVADLPGSTVQPPPVSTVGEQPLPIEVDPAATLDQALAALENGYRFSSETKVNGQTAVTVEGRWVEGNSEMTITSGDGTIEYLFVGEEQFVLTPNGDWVELDSTGPSADPLAALAGPLTTDVVDANPDRVVLAATYPGAALDLAVSEVDVALLIHDGRLSEASFVIDQDGNLAESRTVFEQLDDQTSITAPSA